MTSSSQRLLIPLFAVIALTWGCDSDPVGPSTTQPEQSSASLVTYSVRNLGTLGGANSEAYGINDMNVVVGTAQLRSGD
ncbi:MAG TPA: hypothetical protein VIM84_02510, partial [Gemmatimonadales bacterium]